MSHPQNCCGRPSQLMSLDNALQKLLERSIRPKHSIELPLLEALNHVLAEDITSTVSVPPTDNSAVDGYALNSTDFTSHAALPVSLRIPAGSKTLTLTKGTAARIFTGASIPNSADSVVMQEDCIYDENSNCVTINTTPSRGQNIRTAGQDILENTDVLKEGSVLSPQALGLAASVGIAHVKVYQRLKVGIFSTGDELVEPGNSLDDGQIFNSNRYLLSGLLTSLGFDIVDLGIIPDNLELTKQSLLDCIESADIIITTGGASVGEEDHIRAALEELGEIEFWRMAIKPGKPFMFGTISDTPVLGLPGNPSAVLVTFLILARSFLLKSQGLTNYTCKPAYAPASFDIDKTGSRREFIRVRYQDQHLEKHPNQSSGMLSSASWADGLAVVMEGQRVTKGDLIPYYPFTSLLGRS